MEAHVDKLGTRRRSSRKSTTDWPSDGRSFPVLQRRSSVGRGKPLRTRLDGARNSGPDGMFTAVDPQHQGGARGGVGHLRAHAPHPVADHGQQLSSASDHLTDAGHGPGHADQPAPSTTLGAYLSTSTRAEHRAGSKNHTHTTKDISMKMKSCTSCEGLVGPLVTADDLARGTHEVCLKLTPRDLVALLPFFRGNLLTGVQMGGE